MRFFDESEFYCPCGCGLNFNDMDEDFVIDLDRARGFAEVPFILTSSIRCPAHNIVAGGNKTSSHLVGIAADIACKSSFYRYRILTGLIMTGFTRFGIGRDFIHADKDLHKPKELVWVYK